MVKTFNKVRHSRFVKVLFARKAVVFCMIVLSVMVLASVFAPVVAPYGYNDQDYYNVMADPSAEYPLGTDALGRDILSRLIYGGRVSFSVGLLSVFIAAFIGILLGLIAGMSTGLIGIIIMRIMDAISSVPMIILSLFLSAILGKGLFNMCLAIGISMVPTFCRTTRAQTLTVKHADFITAGTLCGASKATITFRHVFPNCVSLNTLTYCDFPSEHWTRIRTNNVIERLNREIRRRTRVVGTFPDGNSALMLVCARLRHVAGTQWGSKKYMNMKHLEAVMDDASIAG